MSGRILTLFGDEVVAEEQKPALKTRGRKKSAKEEGESAPEQQDTTLPEPEALAEPIIEAPVAPTAPVIADLFALTPEPAPAPIPEVAPEPAPAKRTRRKASEEAILDPTAFSEASLFDLFSGSQDLGKIAAEIQQQAAPVQESFVTEIFAITPEPAPVEAMVETQAIEEAPWPVLVEHEAQITPEVIEVTVGADEPLAVIAAPEEPLTIPEIVVAEMLAETQEVDIQTEASAIIAEAVQAEIEVAPEVVTPILDEIIVALEEETTMEIATPEAEAVTEPVSEIAEEAVIATVEVPEMDVTAPLPVAETVVSPVQPVIEFATAAPAPEVQMFEPVAEVVVPTQPVVEMVVAAVTEVEMPAQSVMEMATAAPVAEVVMLPTQPVMEMMSAAAVPEVEMPAPVAEVVVPPAQPVMEMVAAAPVAEVEMHALVAETVVLPARPVIEIVAAAPTPEAEMLEPVAEVVVPPAQFVMEMMSATVVPEAVVTKKKRTKKVVEAAETESETGEPTVSNNLPMDWQGHKTYYTIGEVAALFKVKTSNIRFWTNEFKLKVRTTRKGDRLYTPELVKEVRAIYHLVKERGFTLAGAKARLKAQNKKDVETVDLKYSLQQLRSQLVAIKNQL